MIDFKSRELEYRNILAENFDPDENYREDELILLLDNCVNFQIYQARKIIDNIDPDRIEPFKKFINFCKNIIAIRELIERDFDFRGFLNCEHKIIIHNFFKDNQDLIEKQLPIFKNFENFINFFNEYFIDKYPSNITIEELTCSLSFFKLGRKYFNEIELENLNSKFPKSQMFIEDLYLNEQSSSQEIHSMDPVSLTDQISTINFDEIIFNNPDFLEILQKNHMDIVFERAIYLTLFDKNYKDYFLNLEHRIEVEKSKDDIFLMDDESLNEFREFIDKFKKIKITEESIAPKTTQIFINKNKLNIESFQRLQTIEEVKTP
jgi:hypothetical protein